jgi:sugar O-acyltransferase (sialic acid O-acetyltransferase NeuD family)
MNEIIIVGAGGHARSCIEVIESTGIFKIAGLVGIESEIGEKRYGYSVIASDDDLPRLVRDYEFAINALGQITDPKLRTNKFEELKNIGFKMPSVIASSAIVASSATVGDGTILMHGSIVNSGATISQNCIINTFALIEHDCSVGANTHISTGALINGGVSVGSNTFIGSGAILKQGIEVGNNCVVGLGVKLLRNLPDSQVYIGEGD